MPLYEWRCKSCGSKFEVFTSYENSLGEVVCISCHSTNVRKLLSVIARPSGGEALLTTDLQGASLGMKASEVEYAAVEVCAPTRAS